MRKIIFTFAVAVGLLGVGFACGLWYPQIKVEFPTPGDPWKNLPALAGDLKCDFREDWRVTTSRTLAYDAPDGNVILTLQPGLRFRVADKKYASGPWNMRVVERINPQDLPIEYQNRAVWVEGDSVSHLSCVPP